MLPRHAYLSATMLALAATMTEEDSPVVPSPEPGGAPRWPVTDEAMIDAALRGEPAPSVYEPLRTGYTEIDAALTGAVGGSLNFMIGGGSRNGRNVYKEYLRRNPVWTDPDPTVPKWVRCEQRPRPQQRAAKKARAKRKAKKGWA